MVEATLTAQCVDCGRPAAAVSRRFGVPLCLGHWAVRLLGGDGTKARSEVCRCGRRRGNRGFANDL